MTASADCSGQRRVSSFHDVFFAYVTGIMLNFQRKCEPIIAAC